MLSWSDLVGDQFDASKMMLVSANERDMDELVARHHNRAPNKDPHINVRFVRGKRTQSEARLFQEWAAAMQFPYYFGHNWDAFAECIDDLEWIPESKHLIFLTCADQILSQHPKNEGAFSARLDHLIRRRQDRDRAFATFMEVLLRTAQTWAKGTERWLRVIFQCDPARVEHLGLRMSKAGLPFSHRQLKQSVRHCPPPVCLLTANVHLQHLPTPGRCRGRAGNS